MLPLSPGCREIQPAFPLPMPAVPIYWLIRILALATGGVIFGWAILRQGLLNFREGRVPLTKNLFLTGIVARICSLPLILLGLLGIASGVGLSGFFIVGVFRAWAVRH